jgi:capsular polysaccharide export protein
MYRGYFFYINNIVTILYKREFVGWGRKKTGRFAQKLYNIFGGSLTLLEDGFIRSLGLGVDGSLSFSVVKDNVGIYYDATTPSKLENLLNSYDFNADKELMFQAKEAISLIQKYHISKYNSAPDVKKEYFHQDEKRVLVVAQTAGDASLEYGMLKEFSTDEIIKDALRENPNATLYLKVHPDVLSGKKESDIDVERLDKRVHIIKENLNPIALLKYFDKVYVKTSGMGFEALLVGCSVVCYGMPYYAGWGVTEDRVVSKRRKRVLTVEEIFAGAYILYTHYYNPYKKQKSDIVDTIKSLVDLRAKSSV